MLAVPHIILHEALYKLILLHYILPLPELNRKARKITKVTCINKHPANYVAYCIPLHLRLFLTANLFQIFLGDAVAS